MSLAINAHFAQHIDGVWVTSQTAAVVSLTIRTKHCAFNTDVGWEADIKREVQIPRWDMPMAIADETEDSTSSFQSEIVRVLDAFCENIPNTIVPKHNIVDNEYAANVHREYIDIVLREIRDKYLMDWNDAPIITLKRLGVKEDPLVEIEVAIKEDRVQVK